MPHYRVFDSRQEKLSRTVSQVGTSLAVSLIFGSTLHPPHDTHTLTYSCTSDQHNTICFMCFMCYSHKKLLMITYDRTCTKTLATQCSYTENTPESTLQHTVVKGIVGHFRKNRLIKETEITLVRTQAV